MAIHGSMEAFNPQAEDWTTYAERLQHYLVANSVDDADKKRAILLTVCGAPTYKLLRSLVDGGEVGKKSYDELVKLLKEHYNPKPSAIVQRFRFNCRVRAPGESIASYVAALRELALHCEYGDKLTEMLTDRLVCGVNHKGIQRKLLAQEDLTYDKAYALALSVEASEKDAVKLQNSKPGLARPLPTDLPASEEKVYYTASTKPRRGATVTCYRCGGAHLATQCKHKDAVCYSCKKRGHLARACRSKTRVQTPQKPAQQGKADKSTHYVADGSPSDSESDHELFTISESRANPFLLDVTLNGIPLRMELDTGASVSVLNEDTYENIRQQSYIAPLAKTTNKLRSYTGHFIQMLGITKVKARYVGKELVLPIHVVQGGGPNLMGRDWLSQFQINLSELNLVEPSSPLGEVLDKHSEVFKDELGCVKDEPVKLMVDDQAKPKFFRPRPVPFLLREKIEMELDDLQAKGIISPVQSSPWAAPIVPVLKQNGKMRICGDFKLTINQAAPREVYPLPRIEELFANLAGGKFFSKLDMSNAYLQLPLDEESKRYVTVNTHRGLFQYNRLPFGVSSAPAIFQRYMETLMQGLRGVSVYIDDILVTGASLEEHLENLTQVLERLQAAGLRLNRAKCSFLRPSITYLGHVIDKDGLHPTQEKVRAIKEAPTPRNVEELRSFLGLINYYSKFLPNLSSKLSPLYVLLNKKQRWEWSTAQQKAFQTAKEALQADSLLVHYDPAKPLVVACDASQYGIGAVLSHVMEDQQERPIAYASRTLTAAEKNYSQLEKEALAIIFAVKKFHNYILGRHFEIESDHRPLSFLFSENKRVPQMASSRIQRWALTLASYCYSIRYKAGKHLGNADALSRLPRPVTTSQDHFPADLTLLLNHLSSMSISAANIKEWTSKDPVLSCVRRFLMTGWPDDKLGDEFRPYASRKSELSVLDGCLLWASRIIVPPQGRQLVLEELHDTHPGVSKMKALARAYVWWPGMDAQISEMVKTCSVCQESRPTPAAAPLHPWEWPSQPWSRLHLDYAGPFLGRMFLVLIDAHSKWIDVHIMPSITAAHTIEKLRIVFSTHGLPRKVVTDNGPSFTSEEFRTFLSNNGIAHVTTAPYHPSSNGLVERAVQTFKQGLKRTSGSTIQERLSKFLFQYRITPQTTTGIPPATLLLGRCPRSRFDALFPDISARVVSQQTKQAQQHDSTKPLRSFKVGDLVYTKDFSSTPVTWIPGRVVKCTGPLSYHITLRDGRVVRRHIDALRNREVLVPRKKPQTPESSDSDDDFFLPDIPATPPTQVAPDAARGQPPSRRRSARQRQPPDRLGW